MDDFGSFDFGSYGSDFGGGDLMSQFDPTTGADIGMSLPQIQAQPDASTEWSSLYGGNPTPQSQGGFFGNLFGGGQGGGMGSGSMLPGLLGLGGGLASLGGTLAGGGMGPKPVMGVPQKAALNQAYGANQQLGQFAQGQTPLQMQQASLLQALASGQGLPPGYQQLIEQAFQPQMGSLYNQATQAGRARGFYDSPATAPPGGAILGPGLADLQGQMAQAKLGLMQSLPGLYSQPIQQQMGAAQGQAGGFTNLGGQYPTQQQQNIAPQIGQQIGSGLQGLGQSMQQNQQMAQQQQFQNSLLQAMRPQPQQQTPYQFGGYSGL